MNIKYLTLAMLLMTLICGAAYPESASVRVKDIAHVLEARENQLMGFGLVVGLKNTGDTTQTEFTKQALTNLLSRMGIAPLDKEFKSKNVAAVMVTAKLPAFVNSGQKIDVTVSSLGDATSLQGGVLLMTPLQGADDNVYAVAQGQLSFGSIAGDGQLPGSERRPYTAARIPGGGLVEKEVPVSIEDEYVTLVIDKPDFTTASRIVIALKEISVNARARDAATIVASKDASVDMVRFVSMIESVKIIPDSVAKIAINEQTGTIVMGENVVVSPIALSYGDMNVMVSPKKTVQGATTLRELVSVLNAVGVRPKDMIAILQALKSAGAISADIEVI